MAMPRTVTPKATKVFTWLAVTSLVFGAQAGFAEFQASSSANAAFGSLTVGNASEEATSSNITLLQAKLDSLHAQIRAGGTPNQISQLNALASALQSMITRLQAGYIITAYNVTSDESTLETIVTISFADTSGNTVIERTVIPATTSYTGDSSTSGDDDSASSDSSGGSGGGADAITQMLQQLASQMMGGGGQNPLGNIQGALNNLVSNNGVSSPVEMISDAVKEAVNGALQCTTGGAKGAGNGVAVYDIEAKKVYMPDGTVLEAHSGLGAMMDNPAYVNQKGRGPTPPGVYSLSMRESLFYGTQAIRMTPSSGTQMYGRDGILAHPPLRRGTVGSAGCIAFADYNKFLQAFKNGQVKQVVVVSNAADANKACTKPAPVYNNPNPTGSGS